VVTQIIEIDKGPIRTENPEEVKKVISPTIRRRTAEEARQALGVSERRVCWFLDPALVKSNRWLEIGGKSPDNADETGKSPLFSTYKDHRSRYIPMLKCPFIPFGPIYL
jgi:hypothetical protein